MNTETAGSLPAADACAANNNWNRTDHIYLGHQLYSSADTLRELLTPTPGNSYKSQGTVVKWREGKRKRVDGKLVQQPGEWVRKRPEAPPPEPETDRQYWLGAASNDNQRPAGERWTGEENYGPTAAWWTKATNIWDALPKHDSAIFSRKAATDSPRHGKLAHRLAPLLAFVRGKDPILPSLRHDPANDNVAANPDRAHVAGSSPEATLQAIADAFRPFVNSSGKRWAGGVEWAPTKEHGDVVVRLGTLRFANGEQVERCMVLAEAGKARVGEALLPVGAMLYQMDKPGGHLGPEPVPQEMVRTAGYWASLFGLDVNTVVDTGKDGTRLPRHIKAGRKRKQKIILTQAEQLALLAEAQVCGTLPPVTVFPLGLPTGTAKLSDAFVGGWITKPKGSQPPERWQDAADELALRDEFDRWQEAMLPDDVKALEVAATAANFQEIGEAFGHAGDYARHKGKRILLCANDNAAKIMAAA